MDSLSSDFDFCRLFELTFHYLAISDELQGSTDFLMQAMIANQQKPKKEVVSYANMGYLAFGSFAVGASILGGMSFFKRS